MVGSDLDALVVYRYAAAFSALLSPGPVLLARDSRPHGQELLTVAAQALQQASHPVVLADLVPTPTAQFIVPRKHLAGAIVVTASHNPIEYNGLKFIGRDGCFLGAEEINELFARADQIEPPEKIPPQRVRGQGLIDAVGLHILDTLNLSCIDPEALLRRRFKVVVDTVNGAACFALPTLLEALSCEVIRLHTTPDGTFPRGTEPLPENLADLCQAVIDNGADLGMAVDPDADRLALVDETGTPPGEELTQVLAADGFLRRSGSRKPVTTNISSSMLLDYVTGKYGVEVLRTAVGEINVVNMMQSVDGEIGGEGNGGVILTESHLGRDSLVAAALVLDRLTQENLPLSAILGQYPQSHMVKTKVDVKDSDPDEISRRIAERHPEAEHITIDGLKIQWPDRWLLVRKSNTEPIIRIHAEAPTADEAQALITDAQKAAG